MKKMWRIICFICVLGFLGNVVLIGSFLVKQKEQKSAEEELRQEVKEEPEETELPEETKKPTVMPEDYEEEEPAVEIPIDFKTLKKKNRDIYAWITVPGTNVDYPVVQHPTDDEYYLKNTVDGQSSVYGAIYTEIQNRKDFTDPMTVIYGHNMLDGSMFASLHKFEDRAFFDEHREFVIYTPKHIYHYVIFAAYTYNNRHLLNTFDFQDEIIFRDYLDSIYQQRSMSNCFLEEPRVTKEDKIVTLSTCGGDHSIRYLVQGVLENVE